MYVSPNGTQYRTIAASWNTFQLREQQPNLSNHQVLRAMGEDPGRCLLQQVVGDVTNLRSEQAQYAQWLTNRQQADAVALAEHNSEMSAIEAAVTEPKLSGILAAVGATSAEVEPQTRPSCRQLAEMVRGRRRATAWFHNKPWFEKPWFRKPSWRKIKAPARRPILVLAGVQLSNYRCLPALLKPTGTILAPIAKRPYLTLEHVCF
jgi:hypothetical protein